MTYYLVEPEAPGELGAGTVIDHSTQPPPVDQLELTVDNWAGDDLMTSHSIGATGPSLPSTAPRSGRQHPLNKLRSSGKST